MIIHPVPRKRDGFKNSPLDTRPLFPNNKAKTKRRSEGFRPGGCRKRQTAPHKHTPWPLQATNRGWGQMSLIMGTKFSLGTRFYRILPSQHISYRPEWQNAKAECHDDRHQPEAPHRHSGWGLPEPPNTRPLKLKNHNQKANTQNHVRKTPSSDGYQRQYGYQIPQSSLIRNAPKRTEAKTKKTTFGYQIQFRY